MSLTYKAQLIVIALLTGSCSFSPQCSSGDAQKLVNEILTGDVKNSNLRFANIGGRDIYADEHCHDTIQQPAKPVQSNQSHASGICLGQEGFGPVADFTS